MSAETPYTEITAAEARQRRLTGEVRTDSDGVRRAYDPQSRTFWAVEDVADTLDPGTGRMDH